MHWRLIHQRQHRAVRVFLPLFALLLCLPCPGLEAQRWHASKGLPKALPPEPLEDMAHMSWTRRDGAPSDVVALAQTKDGLSMDRLELRPVPVRWHAVPGVSLYVG